MQEIHDRYENPLSERYASEGMQKIFSPQKKFSTWRRLWLALAESQQELGLPIEDKQLEQMRAHLNDIDFDLAKEKERELRHDVMAHIHTFGAACPDAMPIIHLGATSCFVGDNTDVLLQREALARVRTMLIQLMASLAKFCLKYKDLTTLAYTHFQPAQPTTVGKRASLWLQDLEIDLASLDFVYEQLRLLGCRGTTGTAASFLSLFDGDKEKVLALEEKISERLGLACFAVTGQTYTRKLDSMVLNVLAGIAQSANKFSNDIRLLSNMREVQEPFEAHQVGSSAMAYKRNPMRSERIAALSRLVMTNSLNPAWTASNQWFERTLDDSANRRIAIPEAFLAIDGILSLYKNIIEGMQVFPRVIKKNLLAELPFMATENILMQAVKNGGDRQELHEVIRERSLEAKARVMEEGLDNNLLELLAEDERIALDQSQLDRIFEEENFSGMAKEQTEAYVAHIEELLGENQDDLNKDLSLEIKV